MIELTDITQHYSVRPVLKRISLQIKRGERVVVVGPARPGLALAAAELRAVREEPPGSGPVPALRRGLAEVTAHYAGTLAFVPPSWRRDLAREVDLVEEVARVHGYEKIPEDVLVPLEVSKATLYDQLCQRLAEVLIADGFFEAATLTSPDRAAEIIQRGVERGRARILVGPDAYLFDALARIAPTHYYSVLARLRRNRNAR